MVILGRSFRVGVSGPKIATCAMIRDQFEGDAMARVMSFMFTLFILVPMLAPVLAQGVFFLAGGAPCSASILLWRCYLAFDW